jgi:ribosome-associated protein
MKLSELKEYISTYAQISFSRSSGPGGQNVNKLNTKVTIRLPVRDSDILSDEERERVYNTLKNRINEEGDLVLQVQEERSQGKNREIAIARMAALIKASLKKKKKRIPTKPSAAAEEKRLKEKKRRSDVKKQRKNPPDPV